MYLTDFISTLTTIILNITYGASVVRNSEVDLVWLGETMGEGIAMTGTLGQFLVDFLPILRHIPAWIPGAGFRRKLSFYKRISQTYMTHPFSMVKASLVRACLI